MAELTLAELAEQTGVPARTIRFYIARGLLPGPLKAGRGAVYGRVHLERLELIRRLQASGKTLAEIARVVAGEERRSALPGPDAWWRYPVASDVEVWVRADSPPWRLRRIRNAMLRMAAELEFHQEELAQDGHGD
ncbi:MAG: MerR family transcriptional regulator [Bryobacterales bacterium]|nr:MerR family transcriptional regulator [Bryobacteraceae bacterium]MDW8131915.1 MerR family transcriptional regulator [Bryobacterales bacterium]